MNGTADPAIEFVPFDERHVSQALEIYNHYVKNTVVTFHDRHIDEGEFRKQVFFEDTRYATYAVVDVATGRLAGYCSLAPYKTRCGYRLTAEVTIYLRPEYTGRGLGAEASGLLERRARSQGFHSLLAVICEENHPSTKLVERQGYKRVGHQKEVGYKFGRFLDVVEYQKMLA